MDLPPKARFDAVPASNASQAPGPISNVEEMPRTGTSGVGKLPQVTGVADGGLSPQGPSELEVQGVVDGALSRHNVSQSLRELYVQKLLQDGYSSAELIAGMSVEDFDENVFKKAHPPLIREQARSVREKESSKKSSMCGLL